jgi:hypothetical protein
MTISPDHYYVVMVKFNTGYEAVVDPNENRDQVIRRLARGDFGDLGDIVFIHYITRNGTACVNVTDEILPEAESLRGELLSDD